MYRRHDAESASGDGLKESYKHVPAVDDTAGSAEGIGRGKESGAGRQVV